MFHLSKRVDQRSRCICLIKCNTANVCCFQAEVTRHPTKKEQTYSTCKLVQTFTFVSAVCKYWAPSIVSFFFLYIFFFFLTAVISAGVQLTVLFLSSSQKRIYKYLIITMCFLGGIFFFIKSEFLLSSSIVSNAAHATHRKKTLSFSWNPNSKCISFCVKEIFVFNTNDSLSHRAIWHLISSV